MMIRNHFMALIVLAMLSAFMAVQPGSAVSAEPKPLIVPVLFAQHPLIPLNLQNSERRSNEN